MQLVVFATGVVRCLYDEALDLTAFGPPVITRASHVEPDAGGYWWADLAPVGGPRFGPFPCRTEALSAEGEWLELHWLDPNPSNRTGWFILPSKFPERISS